MNRFILNNPYLPYDVNNIINSYAIMDVYFIKFQDIKIVSTNSLYYDEKKKEILKPVCLFINVDNKRKPVQININIMINTCLFSYSLENLLEKNNIYIFYCADKECNISFGYHKIYCETCSGIYYPYYYDIKNIYLCKNITCQPFIDNSHIRLCDCKGITKCKKKYGKGIIKGLSMCLNCFTLEDNIENNNKLLYYLDQEISNIIEKNPNFHELFDIEQIKQLSCIDQKANTISNDLFLNNKIFKFLHPFIDIECDTQLHKKLFFKIKFML